MLFKIQYGKHSFAYVRMRGVCAPQRYPIEYIENYGWCFFFSQLGTNRKWYVMGVLCGLLTHFPSMSTIQFQTGSIGPISTSFYVLSSS